MTDKGGPEAWAAPSFERNTMTRRDPWYESDNPTTIARSGGWRLFVVIVCAMLGVAVISAAAWGISVALSGPKGAGDVHRQNNDINNRVFAQQHFEDLWAEITADDQKLDQAAADKAKNPGDAFAATNYTGLVNQCISARAQYNADAAKVLQRDWLSSDLPRQIDPLDPKTDCKETAK